MEAVIAAGMQAVETLLAHEAHTWGYLWQHNIHRSVYPSLFSCRRQVIHTRGPLGCSAKYQGRRLVMLLNPPSIHFCNYKFSTVWKTLVDNFLTLCIKRVES